MNRREFAGMAGIVAAAPRAAFGDAARQDGPRSVTYPEFAIRLGETFHLISARTTLQPEARGVSELLLDSAAAVVSRDIETAQASVARFEDQARSLLPDLKGIADGRGVAEFDDVIRRGVETCYRDLLRIEETGEIVVARIPLGQVLCLIRTPLAFEPCLGPLWKKTIKCALISIPMARLGTLGYVGAVGACLFEDVIDVVVDVIADCLPGFQDRVQGCLD